MNYYNEWEPKAAAWLRELISAGLIPKGHVDDRSITEVKPFDLKGYVQCHFFAGIGGWSAALRLAGWPDTRSVWTASLPCQPFSNAGKQLGVEDERHLWPVFFDLVKECKPDVVFGEQVARAIGFNWLDGICADLEAESYAVGALVLGAHSVGAPHRRQRLYWLADSKREGREGGERNGSAGTQGQSERHADECGDDGWLGESNSNGRESRQSSGEATGYRNTFEPTGSGNSGLAHHHPGCEGWNGEELPERAEQQSAGASGSHGGTLADSEREYDDRTGFVSGSDSGERKKSTDLSRVEAVDWNRSQWINCRDGKRRRIPIEPGVFGLVDGIFCRLVDLRPEDSEAAAQACLFPLAQKIGGRVAMLRGFGNAIVPQVAAEFIQAYLDVKEAETAKG